jgi:hypothetical protein
MFIESQRPKPIKVSGHVRTSIPVQVKYGSGEEAVEKNKTQSNDWKRKVERYGEKEERRNKGERADRRGEERERVKWIKNDN